MRGARTILKSVGTLAAAALLLTGCVDSPTPSTPADVSVQTTAPTDALTVVPGSGADAAVGVSRAVFASAPVVVIAGDAPDAMLAGSSAAVALGVPLLPGSGSAARTIEAELDRLNTRFVVQIGDADVELASSGRSISRMPPSTVAMQLGIDLTRRPVADSDALEAVAALTPASATLLTPESSTRRATASPAPSTTPLPAVRRGTEQTDAALLATAEPANLAAVATARAAGVAVHLTDPAAGLLSSPELLQALAEKPPQHVLAVGSALTATPDLGWQVAVATGAARLPGGAAQWFPGHTLVALYGTPGAPVLGVLGEQDAAQSVARAQQLADQFRPLTDTTVVPTFEIIATVAAGEQGGDGNFSNELDPAGLVPWIDAAAQAGMQVILDLQPGRSDFLSQAKQYQALLERPNVGLALDPEWRLQPAERPLEQVGTADVSEVNEVVEWLADLTRDRMLPQKLLVLHQFQSRMIGNRAALDTSRAELAIVIHADGQGSQPDKQSTWSVLHQDAPAGVAWGWKNFIDEDHPMLTPQQTMTEVSPPPALITYQ